MAESHHRPTAVQPSTVRTGILAGKPLLSWVYVNTRSVISKQSEYRLSLGAAGTAFWLTIAIFPAVIAVVSLYGLVVDPSAIARGVQVISNEAPESLGSVVAQQAATVAKNDTGGLSIGFLIALGVTLWSVSDGGYALFRAVREAYGDPPQSYVRARSRAFGMAIVAVLVIGLLIAVSTWLITWWSAASGVEHALALALGIPFSTALLTGVNLVVFRFSVATEMPMRRMLPGALGAAVVFIVLVAGVTLFGSYARNYQAIYGALSGIIVTMLAIYTAMYVLLLSAVANAVITPPPAELRIRRWLSGKHD